MDKEEATAKLFTAIQSGDAAGVKTALDAGAHVNALNGNLETPLHLAAVSNDAYVATLLITHGADIHITDWRDKTPSQRAAESGHSRLASIINLVAKQQGHAGRVTGERKDKGPPQVGG